jgi:hypothetical protein
LLSSTVDVGTPVGVALQASHAFVGPQFSDDQNTVEEDPTGRIGEVPGYHALDVGARYRHESSGVTVHVTAKNVIDRPFVVARRPEGISASGFRQVTATLRWDYR